MEQTFESRFLAARRAVIAARFQNLNAMQLEGVLTTQGPLLLLAGAGSGKTTVLINRIANLIAFGEGSDSQEVPDYMTEEDLTYLETYLKTQDPSACARSGPPRRGPSSPSRSPTRPPTSSKAGCRRCSAITPWTSGP